MAPAHSSYGGRWNLSKLMFTVGDRVAFSQVFLGEEHKNCQSLDDLLFVRGTVAEVLPCPGYPSFCTVLWDQDIYAFNDPRILRNYGTYHDYDLAHVDDLGQEDEDDVTGLPYYEDEEGDSDEEI